jgi:hypothetical protein
LPVLCLTTQFRSFSAWLLPHSPILPRSSRRQQQIEEKEIRRAEIYALNALMRAYHEAQFESFMQQRGSVAPAAAAGGRRGSVSGQSETDNSDGDSSSESDA